MFLNVVRTREAYPEFKLKKRDLVQILCIVTALSDLGLVPWVNSFYRAPGENGHMRRVPGATSSCTPRESQAKLQSVDRVGIVEGSCGYRARGVSIRGTFVLSRNIGTRSPTRRGGSPCC